MALLLSLLVCFLLEVFGENLMEKMVKEAKTGIGSRPLWALDFGLA